MTYSREYIQDLIIEHFAGTISPEDSEVLNQAIAQYPGVKMLWESMQQDLASPAAKNFFDSIDQDKAWDKVKPDIRPAFAKSILQKKNSIWFSLAALLCVAVAVFYFYPSQRDASNIATLNHRPSAKPAILLRMESGRQLNLSDTSTRELNTASAHLTKNASGLSYQLENNETEEWSTLVVPPTLTYQIVLSDGTKVWLNSASSLRFSFSFVRQTRDVYLTGEAFFKVAKNAAKPFIVHTGQTDVKVLGTAFNINTYQTDKTVTSLVEGSVSTTAENNQKLLLHPGYQAVYQSGTGFSRQPFNPATELSWMKDVYYFHNTRLSEISGVLSRWFDVKVVFDDAAKAEETFTGAIQKNRPVDVFIQNIKASAQVKAVFKDGVLHIK
ncbi:FecR domain-containing protein [Mucilaginibacter sp.]|uniref:FecR domain-containing protein n=1 Tax=Mucilaginibacter sp. TaxID=1882438 RepID=UPI00326476B2